MKLLRTLRPILEPNLGHITALASLALVVIGVLAIDVATDGGTAVGKQLMFVPLGFGLLVLIALPHHRRICDMATPLMIVTLIMLVIVLIPFMPQFLVPMRNGARRWFNLGIVLFQPSELAKIVFVLALARYLRYRENYRTVRGLVQPLLLAFLPMALILVEPDLGTAMIFLPVLFAMLLAAGAKIRHLAMIITLGLVLCPAMYPLLKPHQKARVNDVIARMLGDNRHEQGISFQGKTATTLVGAGGPVGRSPEHAANLVRFNRLPEAHNDMIFAVICTRWGMLGGLIVIGLYMVLMATGLAVAALNKDPFARLVVVGVVTIIFTQVVINVGMNLGILPITGMTLPLMSYGGSSLLANFAMIGLIVNAGAHRPVGLARPSFEFATSAA
ncbi:MAG: rod shape-determining protein RodA [Phycisphaera sp.]|nr:rod shape-determining protein RodA [Phycisphaera sp.]